MRTTLALLVVGLLAVPSGRATAQPVAGPDAAGDIAGFFSDVGDKIYEEDCIFELSDEQIDVQEALFEAYVRLGATNAVARELAANQIQVPELSTTCKKLKGPKAPAPKIALPVPPAAEKAAIPQRIPRDMPKANTPALPASVTLASKQVLPQWDCAPGVDFVTIKRDGFERKLTGGEICNPFQDVVYAVPAELPSFRFGYTIKTGRLFLIADGHAANGKTIAWAISGREVCRNNPDPDCLGARAIGPLPPGEYSFSSSAEHRVSWGPKTKRQVAGIYLKKLWHRETFTKDQVKAILARGNIAIHVRLKGEMSEACLGLEPKGWAYVASLIKEGRATSVNVYIDEPHPQVAEAAPVITASSFSLMSLMN